MLANLTIKAIFMQINHEYVGRNLFRSTIYTTFSVLKRTEMNIYFIRSKSVERKGMYPSKSVFARVERLAMYTTSLRRGYT